MRELNKKNLVVLSIEVIRAAVVSLVTLNPLETYLARMILKNISAGKLEARHLYS